MEMKYYNRNQAYSVAHVISHVPVILNAGDMLGVLAEAGYNGCDRIMLDATALGRDFYDLRTGVAGDILQKISNYRLRLAIVGDFSQFTSKNWRDFVGECNRGRMVRFASHIDEAMEFLQS